MDQQSKLTERILDQAPDALICANDSGTIIRWNRASTALFGYSSDEALGQSVELIIPDHLRAAHWSGFDSAMTGAVAGVVGNESSVVSGVTHPGGNPQPSTKWRTNRQPMR